MINIELQLVYGFFIDSVDIPKAILKTAALILTVRSYSHLNNGYASK